jgi:hypothetical protein
VELRSGDYTGLCLCSNIQNLPCVALGPFKGPESYSEEISMNVVLYLGACAVSMSSLCSPTPSSRKTGITEHGGTEHGG